MAERNFWYIENGKVVEGTIDFIWVSGMARVRRTISCRNLHAEIKARVGLTALDISSASPESLGVSLSAFNLIWDGKPIEVWYQGSKVYAQHGAAHELYSADSMTAKKSMEVFSQDMLIGFTLLKDGVSVSFPMQPKTLFYDWIYLSAMYQNYGDSLDLSRWDALTDIQAKLHIDACQARTVCEYKLLQQQGRFDVLNDRAEFLKWHQQYVGVKKPRVSGVASINTEFNSLPHEDYFEVDASVTGVSESDLNLIKLFGRG